jgi:hypothetical protein
VVLDFESFSFSAFRPLQRNTEQLFADPGSDLFSTCWNRLVLQLFLSSVFFLLRFSKTLRFFVDALFFALFAVPEGPETPVPRAAAQLVRLRLFFELQAVIPAY